MGPYLDHPKCHGEGGTLLLQKPFLLGPASSTVAQRRLWGGAGPGGAGPGEVRSLREAEAEAPAGSPSSPVIPPPPQCALLT